MWKNDEFKKYIMMMSLVIILTALAVGFLFSPLATLLCAVSELLLTTLFISYTYQRVTAINQLSDEVDRVLHGQKRLSFSEAKEGELYILSTEIEKMTLALISQADERAAQKQAISQAVEDISHQLRTPLTAMSLAVDMLAEEGISKTEQTKYIRDLKELLLRMRSLTVALLKMAKLDSGTITYKKEDIRVAELINSSLESLRIPLEIKEIRLHLDCGEATFIGDKTWCAEAMDNLLKNCVEHTSPGGMISVSAQETPIATEIIIADNGEGFSPKDIPHLFERFYRGENASPYSVGIGLAMTQKIIKAHNGVIKAENGQPGAIFKVKFYKRTV